ncbi:MAG: N-formylglutamate amidohydrolase [Bacillus subtilis]|nr:N-formylglutamate amidohydrolase [Bacillus subtilis]
MILTDCHSFHVAMESIHQDASGNEFPDISAFGFNPSSSVLQATVLALAKQIFMDAGYRVSLNQPYSGSMIPNGLIADEDKFASIMIEVNKKIYLTHNQMWDELILSAFDKYHSLILQSSYRTWP